MLGQHLLGIYEKALEDGIDHKERLSRAKSLGFDFVELSIDEQDSRLGRLYHLEQERRDILRAIELTGIGYGSMCLSGHRRFPFGSSAPATAEIARELMRLAIKYASAVGIRVIQLAGYDVYYETSTTRSRQAFLDGMKYACDEAARYQVMLSMEIMDTEFMSNIPRYLRLKEQLNSPWMTVYPDLGNLTAWNSDVLEQLEAGLAELAAIHVKETVKVSSTHGGKFKGVPFGTGDVDFAACFGKLEKLGYTGPYLIEMWHQPGRDDQEAVLQARSFVEQQYQLGVRG